jgi:hypothetical protein
MHSAYVFRVAHNWGFVLHWVGKRKNYKGGEKETMDFRSANVQTQPGQQPMPAGTPGATVKHKRGGGDGGSADKWLRLAGVVLLFSITVLLVALIWNIAVTKGGGSSQNKFVTTSDYQAVFLTNGQVYFGHITDQGSDYIQLQNIFYLTQNTSTAANGTTTTDGNYTLVKLGCQQIHDPLDQMIIERSQVSFWENLNASGKVVTSIKQFDQQNPKGPDCSNVSSQTQASGSSASSTTGTTATGTSTTGTSTTSGQ